MSKIIPIGDVHGRDTWKQIVNANPDADKFIFIGDYFDSFNLTAEKQVHNFLDIMQFRKSEPDRVVNLLGNHDFHYLDVAAGDRCSGYQDWGKFIIEPVLRDHLPFLKMAHRHEQYLFTHAGVTNTWCRLSSVDDTVPDSKDMEQFINDVFKFRPRRFTFMPGKNGSAYGDDVTQSPIWVREKSLLEDHITGLTQVVGHTRKRKVEILKSEWDMELIMVDTQEDSYEELEYVVIEDGKHRVEKLKINNGWNKFGVEL